MSDTYNLTIFILLQIIYYNGYYRTAKVFVDSFHQFQAVKEIQWREDCKIEFLQVKGLCWRKLHYSLFDK